MAVDFLSLLFIVALAAVCPVLADRVPNRIIPETVFLLIVGCLFGQHGFGLITVNETIGFLSELGAAFLFLLAGYEIEPDKLLGAQGKQGLATWVVTFIIAILVCGLIPQLGFGNTESVAMAIMLTTTAIGTLMPILAERKLIGTPVGDGIISYGTWGEIGPIVAIALLLSARATWQVAAVLVLLVALCGILAARGRRARRLGTPFYQFLHSKANTTSQTFMRFTMFLLIALVTGPALFGLDIVFGAFAAGFVLRIIVPEGSRSLEVKLGAMGHGFFIPLFFICSGAQVDITAVGTNPLLLAAFIVALILVRAVPILVSLSLFPETRSLSPRSRFSIAIYCTTALPLIVAASSAAVSAGAMSQEMSSTLVAAGALTVFLMPLLGQLAYNIADTYEVRADAAHAGDTRLPLSSAFALERLLRTDTPPEQIAQAVAQHLKVAKDEKRALELAKRLEAIRTAHQEEGAFGTVAGRRAWRRDKRRERTRHHADPHS